MIIPRIFFFTLLVILTIAEIHSNPEPGGAKRPKSSGSKTTAEENVHGIDEKKMPEDVYGDSAINSQTINKPVKAVPGDDGYISPNNAGPSASNPSQKYSEDSPILSTNPLNDALSSIDFGNKPETLPQLSEKGDNTKKDGASATEVSKSTLLSQKIDEMKRKLKNHELQLQEQKLENSLDQKKIDPIRQATPAEIIPHIMFKAPEMISWRNTWRGSKFEHIKVPDELKTNTKSYKEWFMKTLPDRGYYQDKVGKYLKSINEAKVIIKLQDYETYGFVVPERVIYVNEFRRAWMAELPEWAKVNFDKFNEWLHEEIPKHYRMYILYNSHLSIRHEGSWQSINGMKNNIKNLEKRLEILKDSKDPQKIDPMRHSTPSQLIFREIVIPDVIFWKTTFDGSEFTDIRVPEELKTKPKLYKEWFMKTLPDQGYHRNKAGRNDVGRMESLEQTKTLIKLQDHETYGFVVPKEVIYVDIFDKTWIAELPEKAKVNLDKFNEWLREEMPKHFEMYLIYNPSLSIKYRGSLKYIDMKRIPY